MDNDNHPHMHTGTMVRRIFYDNKHHKYSVVEIIKKNYIIKISEIYQTFKS